MRRLNSLLLVNVGFFGIEDITESICIRNQKNMKPMQSLVSIISRSSKNTYVNI